MEEFNEMLEALGYECATEELESIADSFKCSCAHQIEDVERCDKVKLLDAMVDQIVTSIGVGHMLGMDILGALAEVNRSNFSKFEDGKAVFNENGKITKGKDYTPPQLAEFVSDGK
jgi:predicted HAD superfamily Cof-like phosphohydrolase